MKREITIVMACGVAALLFSASQWLPAAADDQATVQQGENGSGGLAVALLDVKKVFQNFDQLQRQLAKIKAEIAEVEKGIGGQQAALKKLNSELSQLQEGSRDYIDLQQLISTDSVKLKALLERKKAEFLGMESDAYADCYELLSRVVVAYSKEHKISLVLRHSGESIDRSDRNTVLQAVNRAIIFEDGLDITDDIIRLVNAR